MTSTIRAYLEDKAAQPEKEWLRREPRETHPEILELVREFHAGGGFYNDDAERFIEERVGDLPEHRHHGHDERERLTDQLGHEVYIAKGLLRDEELAAELAAALDDGYRPIGDVSLEDGKRYTVRPGTLYGGQTVPSFTNPTPVRAAKLGDDFVFIVKQRRNGFPVPQTALVKEGWE